MKLYLSRPFTGVSKKSIRVWDDTETIGSIIRTLASPGSLPGRSPRFDVRLTLKTPSGTVWALDQEPFNQREGHQWTLSCDGRPCGSAHSSYAEKGRYSVTGQLQHHEPFVIEAGWNKSTIYLGEHPAGETVPRGFLWKTYTEMTLQDAFPKEVAALFVQAFWFSHHRR
ncbi:hypothetical protein [Alkalicoccus urumqiensis]|uniref:hypothetical protein n=1 Tax=Alkalicoccus urumqiensis TaxID=1548213 RepID=UPI0015E5F777|nr:hypothetical protein [Alkalicoccus urumqiensis]